jgi:hypothetical protein
MFEVYGVMLSFVYGTEEERSAAREAKARYSCLLQCLGPSAVEMPAMEDVTAVNPETQLLSVTDVDGLIRY